MIPLAPPLLELARSIAPDDGALLVRSLRAILRQACPFDAGELALVQPESLKRLPLEPGGAALGSQELVAHVAGLGAPLRLDDLKETAPAGGPLLVPGYRSLLALPLASAGGPAGALLLVRRYPWAFVAAPLRDLQAIVGMAGLGLERSFWLSALTQHGRDLHAAGAPHPPPPLVAPPAPPAADRAPTAEQAPGAEPAPAPMTAPVSSPGGSAPTPPGAGTGRRWRRRRTGLPEGA